MKENYYFIERVKEYFGALETQYGFVATKEHAESRGSFVVYESEVCFVSIAVEEICVYLDLGRRVNPQNAYSLLDAIQFLSPLESKEISVFGVPNLPYPENVEHQLGRLSALLFQYAHSILSGRFQEWDLLEEFAQEQAKKIAEAVPKMLEQVRREMYRKDQ